MNVQVDAITMEMYLVVRRGVIAEDTHFHGICNGCRSKRRSRIRVVELLSVYSGIFILIELMGPVCCLVCNESSSGTHELDYSIWRPELTHVAGVPSYFRFCGKVENDFSVIDTGREIRDVRVNGIKAIIYVHGKNVQ